MKETPLLGVIGGSGLYSLPDLEKREELILSTPFGEPSSPIILGTLKGHRVAFIARHGQNHSINPSEINYRANIYAIKSLGIKYLLSVSACGSLREDFEPGHIVVPDQLYDNTHLRSRSFFEKGMVAHVGVAEPFCPEFREQVKTSCEAAGAKTHSGGTFITVEGPRFSTLAESNLFRSWGISIIGMTTSPEAFLAREAELHYAVLAHVTDYDVWHDVPVSVEMVINTISKNIHTAQDAIRNLAATLNTQKNCDCDNALESAMITNVSMIPKKAREKLGVIIEKYSQ